MTFNAYIFYTLVRLNSLSISNIEKFERFMNLNWIFSYGMISEQFNDVSSINNKAFNLFIDRIYYLLQLFNGHLNRHNSFFFGIKWRICTRTPISSTYNLFIDKYCTIIIRHYCFSSHLIGRNNDFLLLRDAYVNAVPLFIGKINILRVTII